MCRCGCDKPVARGRRFVNEEHYSAWLSQERYFGKNRKLATSLDSSC